MSLTYLKKLRCLQANLALLLLCLTPNFFLKLQISYRISIPIENSLTNFYISPTFISPSNYSVNSFKNPQFIINKLCNIFFITSKPISHMNYFFMLHLKCTSRPSMSQTGHFVLTQDTLPLATTFFQGHLSSLGRQTKHCYTIFL